MKQCIKHEMKPNSLHLIEMMEKCIKMNEHTENNLFVSIYFHQNTKLKILKFIIYILQVFYSKYEFWNLNKKLEKIIRMEFLKISIMLHHVKVISMAIFSIKSKEISLSCLKDLGKELSIFQCVLKCRNQLMNPAMIEERCFCEMKDCRKTEEIGSKYQYLSSIERG